MKKFCALFAIGLFIILSSVNCSEDEVTNPDDGGNDPTVNIIRPSNGESFVEGDTISFAGSGVDHEGTVLTDSSLIWTSDKEGQIGTGTSFFKADLSLVEHRITLTCTDSDSNSDTDNITIYVDPNHDPVATIIEPSDSESFDEDETITFYGQGTDEEDGALSGSSLVWTSDKDGFIGTDNILNTSDLSVNEHDITLTASDNHGNTGSDNITITVYSSSGGDFVLIPADTFTMGSPGDEWGRSSDETLHLVTLTHDFYLSETEVTNQQYADMAQWAYDNGYCTANSSTLQDDMDGSTQELLDLDDSNCEISFSGGTFTVDSGKENHPVIEVSWYGAVSYCDWLSMQAGLTREYDHGSWECNGHDPYNAGGYRLPTEAEWEYACRAGTQTPFNTGNCLDADTEANYNGSFPYTGCPSGPFEFWTVPVANYPDNGFELYDMHGNVWEWCNDWFASCSGDKTDPVGPSTGASRVLRGGSWFGDALFCRSAYRSWGNPADTSYDFGFRVCRGVFAR
ncbi:MAG: SUMF1/EgtB/PvdO family nonheme iron enzyme [Candidatus Latescibacteria bacterium]|nr:SUMF1/EgtB/PvdO family nonheme iron enzyme [Candidatus Latescibacterota bacterium]